MHWIMIAITVGLVTAFWSWINYNRSPQATGFDGSITPGKISAVLVTIFGIIIVIFGVTSLFANEWTAAAICIPVGAALTIFMGPSITHMHDVNWNVTEINGPCRLFGLGLGYDRTIIRWEEIPATGKTFSSYWFIQSSDGRRVYWSYLYPGYGELVVNIVRKCPDIQLPIDLR